MTVASEVAALDIQDVFKIYREGDTETVALRGLNLRVPRGEVVALMGRSGAGKSTLLNLIGGMDTPSAGRVLVAGQDMGRLGEEERAALRRRAVGFVFQDNNLLPYLSAGENVALAAALGGVADGAARADELLAEVGLRQRASHRPHQLSGGERQRVGVACALACRPALLLADEITGELDSATADRLLGLVVGLARQEHTAVLLVTHNERVAGYAERVLTIEDGVVASSQGV
ncbi:MAG: ABC transporter ATP-binding protein [Chloroflexota bacterium]